MSNMEQEEEYQLPTNEQEQTQKKTFTNWINSFLRHRVPPMRVNDLFEDIRTGEHLLALLEMLSGEKLPTERGANRKRPHFISNITTALKFLEQHRIKLVNINPSDVVDGKPSIVLGLIWSIILFFQIENVLPQDYQMGSSRSSVASSPVSVDGGHTGGRSGAAAKDRFRLGAKKAMLMWAQTAISNACRGHERRFGIEVKDFGASWRDGVAFNAIIHNIRPDLVDLSRLPGTPNLVNLDNAFRLGEEHLGIPRILDPEDVDVANPDERSVMTYVAQFLKKYPDPNADYDDAAKLRVSYTSMETTAEYHRHTGPQTVLVARHSPSSQKKHLEPEDTIIAIHSPSHPRRRRPGESSGSSLATSPTASPMTSTRSSPRLVPPPSPRPPRKIYAFSPGIKIRWDSDSDSTDSSVYRSEQSLYSEHRRADLGRYRDGVPSGLPEMDPRLHPSQYDIAYEKDQRGLKYAGGIGIARGGMGHAGLEIGISRSPRSRRVVEREHVVDEVGYAANTQPRRFVRRGVDNQNIPSESSSRERDNYEIVKKVTTTEIVKEQIDERFSMRQKRRIARTTDLVELPSGHVRSPRASPNLLTLPINKSPSPGYQSDSDNAENKTVATENVVRRVTVEDPKKKKVPTATLR